MENSTPASAARARRRRPRRAAVSLIAAFLIALGGLWLARNTAALRGLLLRGLDARLAAASEGRVRLLELQRWGWSGVDGLRVRVESGAAPLATFEGVSVRAPATRLVWAALTGRAGALGAATLHVDHAELWLDAPARWDAALSLLGRARAPDGERQLREPSNAVRATELELRSVHVVAAELHDPGGRVWRLRALEGAVERFDERSRLRLDSGLVQLALARGPDGVERPWVDGQLSGLLELGAAQPGAGGHARPKLEGRFDGTVARTPVALEVQTEGEDVDVQIETRPQLLAASLGIALPDGAGTSSLELHGRARGTLARAALEVELRGENTLVVAGGEARVSGGLDAPRATIDLEARAPRVARLTLSPTKLVTELQPTRLSTTLSVLGPRRSQLSLELERSAPRAPFRRASFAVQTELPDLTAVSQALELPLRPRGSGRFEARGHIDLGPEPSIAAELHGRGDGLGVGGFGVQRLVVDGSLTGSLAAPELEVRVQAEALGDRRRQIERLRASLKARQGPSGFELRDVTLSGAGNLAGRLVLTRERGAVELHGRELDVGRLVSLITERPAYGHADVRANLALWPELEGDVTVLGRELGWGELRDGRLDAGLRFAAGQVSGRVTAQLERAITLELSAEQVAWRRWARARAGGGVLDVTSNLDLSALQRATSSATSLGRVGGRLEVRGRVEGAPGQRPRAHARARTHGFWWQPRALEDPALGVLPSDAVDLELSLALTPEPTQSTATLDVEARLFDELGTVLRAAGQTRLPTHARDLAKLELGRHPLTLGVALPDVELSRLPAALARWGTEGRARGRIGLEGTLASPRLHGDLELSGLHWGPPEAPRVDVDLDLRYADERAEASARAALSGRPVLDARLVGAVPGASARWLAQARSDSAVDVRLTANLSDFPLRSLAFLGDDSLTGSLSGRIDVRGLGTAGPRGTIEARATSLTLGGLPGQRAALEAELRGDELSAELELLQSPGTLVAELALPVRWTRGGFLEGGAATPSGRVTARDFRLLALRPLVPGHRAELDGLLSLDLALGAGVAGHWSGGARISHGVVDVPWIGQKFREVSADLEFAPPAIVRLTAASARAVSGRLQLQGEARLEPRGLADGELALSVAESESVPVAVRGVPVGSAWGNVHIVAKRERTGLALRARVPHLRLLLPATAPRGVVELEPDPTIEIGTYRGDGEFAPLPTAPDVLPHAERRRTFELAVELGRDVWLQRGTELEARVEGELTARVDSDLALAGTVLVPEGLVEIQGRPFVIQPGATLTFPPGGDPSNPIVMASARWRAPEDFDVFAQFAGPVDTGSLSFRASPPLDDDGIVSLLTFGSPDFPPGMSAASARRRSAAALRATSDPLALGLTEGLSELTSFDVQPRMERSRGYSRPEVALLLAPNLTAELGYGIGAPSPGDPPDVTFLTLEMRLQRNWSIATTVGNQGSAFVDMLWRYRY